MPAAPVMADCFHLTETDVTLIHVNEYCQQTETFKKLPPLLIRRNLTVREFFELSGLNVEAVKVASDYPHVAPRINPAANFLETYFLCLVDEAPYHYYLTKNGQFTLIVNKA
jgi:hypothetical protein